MVNGVTFSDRLTKSENDRPLYYAFNARKDCALFGCVASFDSTAKNIIISDGDFICRGGHVRVSNNHTIAISVDTSGTQYCTLIFEIDLSKSNNLEAFNQGIFKILSQRGTYNTLQQDAIDEDTSKTIYQMAFARFTVTNGVVNTSSLTDMVSRQTELEKIIDKVYSIKVQSGIPTSIGDKEIIFTY